MGVCKQDRVCDLSAKIILRPKIFFLDCCFLFFLWFSALRLEELESLKEDFVQNWMAQG